MIMLPEVTASFSEIVYTSSVSKGTAALCSLTGSGAGQVEDVVHQVAGLLP